MPMNESTDTLKVEAPAPIVSDEDVHKQFLTAQINHQIEQLESARKKVFDELQETQKRYDAYQTRLQLVNDEIKLNGARQSLIQEKERYVTQLKHYEKASRVLFGLGVALTIGLCIAAVLLSSVTFGLSALAGGLIMALSAQLGKYLENKIYENNHVIACEKEKLTMPERLAELEYESVDTELEMVKVKQLTVHLTARLGFFATQIEELQATAPQDTIQATH